MPLPDALKPLLTRRRFWTDFLWETDSSPAPPALPEGPPYPALRDCRVDLPVAGDFELCLSLDENLSHFGFEFVASKQKAIEIAWDDQAHWHPHVLRWSELETICRAIAMRDAELAHPGYAVLLLHRFAPICEGDDLNTIVATLETAWKQLGLFSEGEIRTWIERFDASDAGFRWRRHEPQGWCLEQDEDEQAHSFRGLYTLRQAENEQFPFADWNRMIEIAERELIRLESPGNDAAMAFAETAGPEAVFRIAGSLRAAGQPELAASLEGHPAIPQACWVVEAMMKLAPGSLLNKYAPPACLPRRKYSLDLGIPHQDEERPVPVPFGKLFSDTLDRILRSLRIGSSVCSGGSSVRNDDGTFTETESGYSVHIKGDLDQGLQIVRDLLWWSDAPESVNLGKAYRHGIPLNLGEPPNDGRPLLLHAGRLTTVRWRSGYRFDRVRLPEASRQRLRELLSRWDARGPDEDGWFQVATDEGGRIGLCANRLDDNPGLDGVTITAERLTLDAATLVHQMMSEAELMLLPPLLAPDARVAEQVAAPWPNVRVVDSAGRLYEILAAGPYAWWTGESRP